MENIKKAGRPKNFNVEEALIAAINVFWAKGYDGTSMKDLTDAMGINKPSLYATYGDKLSLYHKAIHGYSENSACEPLVAFESETDIRLAVRAFLATALKRAISNESGAKGCFLSSSVATSAGEVEGVECLLGQAVINTDAKLAKRFDQEIKNGNLPPDFPSKERARLMFDLRQGHVFRARAGLSEKFMETELNQRVEMVLAISYSD